MHGSIVKLLRRYPFTFAHYYQNYGFENTASLVRELRQSPALLFQLSEHIRKVRETGHPENTGKVVSSSALTPGQKIDLLGLMSFSSNGYMRQAALQAMHSFGTVDILPFLVLRLQDWVLPVREMAQTMFDQYAALATPKDWEQAALLINRITERSHGGDVRALVLNHFKHQYHAEDRAGWFLGSNKDMRRLLWSLFTDDELKVVATPAFLNSESDPRLAGEIFQKLLKILPREDVLRAGVGHVSNRIRYAALQALYKSDGIELKSVTQAALSDKSANVRDLARFIYHNRFGIHPRDHYIDFDLAPDDNEAKLGYVMGWLESSRSDPQRFLEFHKRSPRGKIRGAALMAYARVGGYTDDAPAFIIDAFKSGSHCRDVAAKLIKMGWASEISTSLWELADQEPIQKRQMRLYNLAAQSDWSTALMPALRRMPNAIPSIQKQLMDIIVKWSRQRCVPTLTTDQKTEGLALIKQIGLGRHKTEWLKFLFA